MRSSGSIWLSLTQLALLAGCSGQLPLEVPDRAPLPTEVAGSGAITTGAAGAAAAARRGRAGSDGMTQPMRRPPICGDNVIEPPMETCDRANLNGITCANLGYNGGGQLLCNPTTCQFDVIMCRVTPWPQPGEGAAGSWSAPTPSGADAGTEDAG